MFETHKCVYLSALECLVVYHWVCFCFCESLRKILMKSVKKK